MPCLICGATNTVKSHIIPRSLFRIQKGTRPKVVRTRRRDFGWDESQSGFFDTRLLCNDHEKQLGKFDDYAARFCRTFKRAADTGCPLITVKNPRPELLVGFACAVVWRMAASRSDLKPEQMLGAGAQRISDRIFKDGPFDPILLLGRNPFYLYGEPLEMNVLPVPYSELDRQFWRFIACGIVFDLMIDERPVPNLMAPLGVNTRREVTLVEDFPQDAMKTPGLGQALIGLALPRRPYRAE
jgi:hypothetical protein